MVGATSTATNGGSFTGRGRLAARGREPRRQPGGSGAVVFGEGAEQRVPRYAARRQLSGKFLDARGVHNRPTDLPGRCDHLAHGSLSDPLLQTTFVQEVPRSLSRLMGGRPRERCLGPITGLVGVAFAILVHRYGVAAVELRDLDEPVSRKGRRRRGEVAAVELVESVALARPRRQRREEPVPGTMGMRPQSQGTRCSNDVSPDKLGIGSEPSGGQDHRVRLFGPASFGRRHARAPDTPPVIL